MQMRQKDGNVGYLPADRGGRLAHPDAGAVEALLSLRVRSGAGLIASAGTESPPVEIDRPASTASVKPHTER